MVTRRRIVHGVASIEGLVSRGRGTGLILQFSAEMQTALMRHCSDPCPPVPCAVVPRSQLHGILDAVRNAILTWSLELESDGIVGDGMSFLPKEKGIAAAQAASLRPIINLIAIEHMENSSIQQGTEQSCQHTDHQGKTQ